MEVVFTGQLYCVYNIKIRQRISAGECEKDTVTVDTPHSSSVAVVSAKPLAIDRVPHVGYLQSETSQQVHTSDTELYQS